MNVSISPDGAELRSIVHRGKEFLYQGDKGWKRRAPLLFPWAGRLRDLKYLYDNKEYSLPQHGFARDMTFSTLEKEEDRVVFEISSDSSTLQSYPRPFRLRVEYRVEGNSLHLDMSVENTGEEEMTYGIGIHPGFIAPDEGALLSIMPSGSKMLFLDKNGKPMDRTETTASPLPLSFFRDNMTLIVPGASFASLESKERKISLNMLSWPNLVVWRNDTDPFICLETWGNLPAEEGEEENFNTRRNVQRLEGKGKATFSLIFSFSN